MKTLLILLLCLFTNLTFAQESAALGKLLYPAKKADQTFVEKFFNILKNHKTNDPLLGGKGPSVHGYKIDKMKFAFLQNVTADQADIVIFNWDLKVFPGLEVNDKLSALYGSPVYILKNLDALSIASQGENRDSLTNFSYLQGSETMAESYRRLTPNGKVPDEFADWKPHANYMKRTHPLRQTLGTNALVLLSPEQRLVLGHKDDDEIARNEFIKMLGTIGGFELNYLGMMIHEMFHIKENQDHLGLTVSRKFYQNPESILQELKMPQARKLIEAYTNIIFGIGRNLNEAQGKNTVLLIELAVIIQTLKNDFPKLWKYIWDYEYTEGFAEYASAQSLIDINFISMKAMIEHEITNKSNNIVYRTGTIGGLYLKNVIREMPFNNQEDHFKSLWEIILSKAKLSEASDIDEILNKHTKEGTEFEEEIKSIEEYLLY